MSQPRSRRRVPAALAAGVAIMLAAMTSAWGYAITTTPTLPVLGSSFASSTGAGCFPAVPPAGVCVGPGTFTLNSLVSSTFDLDGQHIVTNVSYAGILTTLGNVPIGPISLSGTMEQEVQGRTGPAAIGTWVTELVSLTLTGTVFGFPLTLTLDDSPPSIGTTSIVAVGDEHQPLFRIDSFFDIFVELKLGTPAPLQTTRNVQVELVPEPSSLALLAGGLVAFASRRRLKVAAG